MNPQAPPAYTIVKTDVDTGPAPVYSFPKPPSIYPNYPSKKALRLSALQIIIGVICIILNSVTIGFGNRLSQSAPGIWGGITFILAGCVGIPAAKKGAKCVVIMSMLLDVVSALFAVPLLIISILSAIQTAQGNGCYFYYCRSYDPVVIALSSVMAFLALVEGIAALWTAGLAMKVACNFCERFPEILTKACRICGNCWTACLELDTQGQYEPLPTSLAQQTTTGSLPAFQPTRQTNSVRAHSQEGDNLVYSKEIEGPESV